MTHEEALRELRSRRVARKLLADPQRQLSDEEAWVDAVLLVKVVAGELRRAARGRRGMSQADCLRLIAQIDASTCDLLRTRL